MKCILHIGTEKTGTTSIQDFLTANRDALSNRRIALSTALGEGNNRALALYFQDNLDNMSRRLRLHSMEAQRAHFKPVLDAFVTEVEAARANQDLFVISTEHLHSRLKSPETVRALRDFLGTLFEEIHVHVYIREQAGLVESIYSTWVEGGGGSITLEEFAREADVANPYYNYDLLFQMWEDAFGIDALHPKVYQRDELVQKDVRKDFLVNALGLSNFSGLRFPVEESNRSLGRFGLAIGRVLNRTMPAFLRDGRRNRLRDAIMRACVLSGVARIGKRTPIKADKIRARFNASNTACATRYFGRDQLF